MTSKRPREYALAERMYEEYCASVAKNGGRVIPWVAVGNLGKIAWWSVARMVLTEFETKRGDE